MFVPSSYRRPTSKLLITSITVATACLFLLSQSSPIAHHIGLNPGTFFHPSSGHPCPSPNDVHLPQIDHSTQQCSYVPSALPAFDLELCESPACCNTFTFRIRRTDHTACSRAEEGPDPSDDKVLSDLIRDLKGPDAFMLRTDGAERIVTERSTHEGGCSYRLDVQLRNPGQIYLNAWLTYENYLAFSEVNASWPDLQLKPLLTNPVALSECPSRCAPASPKPLVPSRTIITYPSASTSAADLPACSGPKPIQGSYLPAHPLDILYPPFVLPAPQDIPVVGRYQFVPAGCEWKHVGTRFGDPSKCTNTEKRVLILGDSHGRVVYDAMLHRLLGNQDILTVSEKAGSKSGMAGDIKIEFFWDTHGYDYILSDSSRFCSLLQDSPVDALIISIGTHYAGLDTTAHHTGNLTNILSIATSCPPPARTPPHLIYLTVPAQPPRQDHWAREFRDHRTNVRLGHWAALEIELALGMGWSVVDTFALTAPHVWEALNIDMAHYLATDAIDPILDEVIGKAGLCPDS